MNKVLLIRRKKEYFYYREIGWKNKHFYKGMTHIWNFFFKMKYNHFREELVKISQETISYNNFNMVVLYEDRELIGSLPNGTLLFPVDEDDWISSSLSLELDRFLNSGKNICWNVYRCGCREKKLFIPSKEPIIPSCGYCVSLPCDFSKITFHWKFDKEGAEYINKTLSVKLDSPASIRFMREKGMSFEKLIKDIYRSISNPKKLPSEFYISWEKYINLCKELLDSCKIPYEHLIFPEL